MIKMILAFIAVFIFMYFSIEFIRKLSNKSKLNLAKQASYAIICAAITIATLSLIVILF